MDAHNITEQCDWRGEGNRTKPRVNDQLDACSCLFLYFLLNEQAVTLLKYISIPLTLISFLINGYSLFALCWTKDPPFQSRFTFLQNLVLSDLLQTFTFGPAVIYSAVHRRTMAFSFWCHVQYFAGTLSTLSSIVTITCMALECYIYVCHSINYLGILTQARLRLVLSLIWAYCISICTISMVLLHTGASEKDVNVTMVLVCEPCFVEQHMGFPRASVAFRMFSGFLTLLVCLLVYAFSYLGIYQDARRAVRPFNVLNAKARKNVIFYCGMLLLQLLPHLLKVISDAQWEVKGTAAMMATSEGVCEAKPPLSTVAVVLHVSWLVSLLVLPCVNPLVYMLRNPDTKHVLLRPFRWWMEKRNANVRRVEQIRLGNIVRQNQPRRDGLKQADIRCYGNVRWEQNN